jgi:hypothetical protein
MKRNEIVAMHSRFALVLALITIAGLGLACGNSSPSESEGRKGLGDYMARIGYVKVKSFTKTNGMGDDKQYIMDFNAEYECLVNCKQVGEVTKGSGKIHFENTEKGWRVTRVEEFVTKQ